MSGGGRIVIIKRNGTDGSAYSIKYGKRVVGSAKDCDILMPLKGSPEKQFIITINGKNALIRNLCSKAPKTIVNNEQIDEKILCHGDVISLNNGKFRWEYFNRSTSNAETIEKKRGVTLLVKNTRKSSGRVSGENMSKKIKSNRISDIKSRNSIADLRTKQVAVVMPQRRFTDIHQKTSGTHLSDRQHSRGKSEAHIHSGKEAKENNDTVNLSSKKRKGNEIQKLEDVTLDKNKRAALMLLTRSPRNRDLSRSVPSKFVFQGNVRKDLSFNSDTSKTYKKNLSNNFGESSENVKSSMLSKTINTSRLSLRKSLLLKKNSKIPLPSKKPLHNRKLLSDPAIRVSTHKNKSLRRSKTVGEVVDLKYDGKSFLSKTNSLNISGVEELISSDSVLKSSRADSVLSAVRRSTRNSTSQFSRNNFKPNITTSNKSMSENKTPVQKKLQSSNLEHSTKSSYKKNESILNNGEEEVEKSDGLLLVSFISSLSNALNIVNNTDSVEAFKKTPEFQALNNKMKSTGKTLNFSIVDSPSPTILEIGKISNKSNSSNKESAKHSNDKLIFNVSTGDSPIISPKHRSPRISGSSQVKTTDIVNTPNLSIVFAVEASTPVEKSVNDKIKHFESLEHLSSQKNANRMSTRNSGVNINNKNISKKISHFEQIGSKTDSLINIENSLNSGTRKSLRTSTFKTYNSKKESHEKTPDKLNFNNSNNEIIVTPKSSIKPSPEIVKERHSTAKKPISKKTIIDHLTQSPEMAKELFKSPVKRKLSQSMKQYDSSKVFEDAQDLSTFSTATDISFELITRPAKRSRTSVAFNFSDESTEVIDDSIYKENSNIEETLIVTRNKKLGKDFTRDENDKVKQKFETPKIPLKDTKSKKINKESKSPKNNLQNVYGVSKMFRSPRLIKSPSNDLSDVRGVKRIFKTTKSNISPQNDLTDVGGVSRMFRSPRLIKSPLNDLRNVKGVRKLLESPRQTKSPKNDLSDVRGVKEIFKTCKSNISPKNDLRDIRNINTLFRTPKQTKSPKNDLRNISGVYKLFEIVGPIKSPKNDLRNVEEISNLFTTPKQCESSENDLSGTRTLRTFKQIRSPKNDLSDVRGVSRILRTPRQLRTPKNDLSDVRGVKKMFQTPKLIKSPKNDLRDVRGVSRVLRTPKQLRTPKNDLSDVEGVKRLLRTPKLMNQSTPAVKVETRSKRIEINDEQKSENSTFSQTDIKNLSPILVPTKEVQKTRKGREKMKLVKVGHNTTIEQKHEVHTRTTRNRAVKKELNIKQENDQIKSSIKQNVGKNSKNKKKAVTFASDIGSKKNNEEIVKVVRNTRSSKIIKDESPKKGKKQLTVKKSQTEKQRIDKKLNIGDKKTSVNKSKAMQKKTEQKSVASSKNIKSLRNQSSTEKTNKRKTEENESYISPIKTRSSRRKQCHN